MAIAGAVISRGPDVPVSRCAGGPWSPRDVSSVEGRPVVIFDTSAINWLTDDAERLPLMSGIKAGFWFRLNGDSFGELVATTDSARRKALLEVSKLLVTAGDCLLPHDELLKEAVKQHAAGGKFDWRAVPVRCKEYEVEIARQEFINDDISNEQRHFAREVGNGFSEIYEGARPAFQELLRKHGSAPLDLDELVHALQTQAGAFWSMASGLYSRPSGLNINEGAARDFVDACPPFRALLIALCLAQHRRCIEDPQHKSAGAFDLYGSVYLPYCAQFVTADQGQQEALIHVASLAELGVEVCSYADFRVRLLGLRGA